MPLNLPDGKKLAVALGADFDAHCLWMADNNTSPSYLSRGEFGAEVGLPRVLDLFQKYHIKATFCVPTHTMLTYPQQIESILKEGHEIAAHGVYHEKVLKLEPDRERELMELQIEHHQKIIGRRPRGYRSPSWDFSSQTLSLLEEFQFNWDSSLMGRDFEPYHPSPVLIDFENGNTFEPPSSILEFPVSWYLDDFPFVEFYPSVGLPGASSASMLYERWKDSFEYAIQNGISGVFVLTVHPQTIGRSQNIMMYERLVQYMCKREEVWFTSLSDIYDCWIDD